MKKTAKNKPVPSGSRSRHLEVEAFAAGNQLVFRVLFVSDELFANMREIVEQNPCGMVIRSGGIRPYVVANSIGLPSERSPSNFDVDVTKFRSASEMEDAVGALRDTVDWINARDFARLSGARERGMVKVI